MSGFFNPEALHDPYIVIVAVEAGDFNIEITESHFIPERRHIFGSWSPDGRAVVYIQWDEGGNRYGAGSLMVYDLDEGTTTAIEYGDKIRNPDW